MRAKAIVNRRITATLRLGQRLIAGDAHIGDLPDSDAEVVLLTPTWRGDFDSFISLRRSLKSTSTDFPHIAVVHTEDASDLATMVDDDVQIVPSSALLPRWLEQRRRFASMSMKRDSAVARRLREQGWIVQQVIKLAGAAALEARAVVLLDSDNVVVRRLEASTFLAPDGRAKLFYAPLQTMEQASWALAAIERHGLDSRAREPVQFTTFPQVFDPIVVRALIADLDDRGSWRRPWMEPILRRRTYEYEEYAAFALSDKSPRLPEIECLDWTLLVQPPPWGVPMDVEHVREAVATNTKFRLVNLSSKLADQDMWGTLRRELASGIQPVSGHLAH